MKSSSLFLLVLLALGTLAPWAVEGDGKCELESLWYSLGCGVRDGGRWWWRMPPALGSGLSLISGGLPEGGALSVWAAESLRGLLSIWRELFSLSIQAAQVLLLFVLLCLSLSFVLFLCFSL